MSIEKYVKESNDLWKTVYKNYDYNKLITILDAKHRNAIVLNNFMTAIKNGYDWWRTTYKAEIGDTIDALSYVNTPDALKLATKIKTNDGVEKFIAESNVLNQISDHFNTLQ